MEEAMRVAFETVDSARAHKFELEANLNQLQDCINQVSVTSSSSLKDIEAHSKYLQDSICKLIQLQADKLLKQVNTIKKEALDPLNECKVILEDGIAEADTVIKDGEILLQQGDNQHTPAYEKELQKFNSLAESLALDSVPEVPLTSEVACISVSISECATQEIMKSIEHFAIVHQQSPVFVESIEERPGALLVSWAENDSEASEEWIASGNSVFYRLQYCQGKIKTTANTAGRISFKDVHIGKKFKHSTKHLSPNTAYTFRVSQCFCSGEKMDTDVRWSPWSVYMTGMTTLPRYEWLPADGYHISNSNTAAEKNANSKALLYSKENIYPLGYPIHYSILQEGKLRSSSDGFAFVYKTDHSLTSLNTEGAICITTEGKIFVNGHESHTKFETLHKGCSLSFKAVKLSYEESHQNKRGGNVTLRVTITVGSREAVFDWIVKGQLKANKSKFNCLTFGASFRTTGWKISVS